MPEQKKGAFMGQISKQFMVEEAQKHIDLDMYRAGDYGDYLEPYESFKACSVGCSIHSINQKLDLNIGLNDHEGLAEALNIPGDLVFAQDDIFEALEGEDQILWTKRFYQAIPEGADLQGIKVVINAVHDGLRQSFISEKECADKLIEILGNCEVSAGQEVPTSHISSGFLNRPYLIVYYMLVGAVVGYPIGHFLMRGFS